MNIQQDTPRFGMVVDVNRCVGCQTCTIACKHSNDTAPDIQWRSVLDVEQGQMPDVSRFFLVTGCQHCENPPCVPVCPTGATFQREDGLVVMDYNRCIGCGYCAVACPYQARTIAHEQDYYYGTPTIQEDHVAHPERIGVAQKCTFCIERVDSGLAEGLAPGIDADATPACAASCIAGALTFGDFNDPDSKVSHLTKDANTFQINDFLGTDPQIKYLYDVPGNIEGRTGTDDHIETDPTGANPLEGNLQKFWDMRAAMNFILGGIGSGFLTITVLAMQTRNATGFESHMMLIAGAIIVSLGLFFVFLKIGRKRRFLNAILRPQSSWMTREIYIVALLFPLIGTQLLVPVTNWLGRATPLWLVWSSSPVLSWAMVGAALLFLFSQARILFAAKGIPVWRARPVPFLLFATGLSEGSGLYLMATALSDRISSAPWIVLLAGLSTLTAAACWYWLTSKAQTFRIPPISRQVLATMSRVYLPALTLGLATLFFVPPLGGAILVGSGAVMKAWLITRAAFQQGLILPAMPKRGSGNLASPPRLNGTSR